MDAPSPASVASAIPSGLESDAPTTKILRLLRVVHGLTTEARDVSYRHDQMDENLFVNNKLTAKLTRQLEEIMLLAR
jgi:E3 ubiquitin-protein ligase TRIP12